MSYSCHDDSYGYRYILFLFFLFFSFIYLFVYLLFILDTTVKLFFSLIFRACVKKCEETGCVGQRCFPHCKFSMEGVYNDVPWYMQEPLYLQWKQCDCQSDCRYYCMLDREKEREAFGHGPVKYHGKWPFKRVYGIQVCFLIL
jgi:hypothetical protein